MKVTYDPNQDVSYIELKDPCKKVERIELNWEVLIDMSSDDKVCSIKLIHSTEKLKILDGNVYLRINDLALLIEGLMDAKEEEIEELS